MNRQQKLELFKTRFVHRTDRYSRQWWSKPKNDGGYIPVTDGTCDRGCPSRVCPHVTVRAVNDVAITQHLLGKTTLGFYQLGLKDTVKWLVWDVDLKKRMTSDMTVAQGIAKNIARQLVKYGFHGEYLVEDSGGRGYHVWMFFEDAVKAASANAFGHWISSKVEVDERFSIEVYPKQISTNSMGAIVKPPFSYNRKTMRQCAFVDSSFERKADQWETLDNVIPVTADRIAAFLRDNDIKAPVSLRRESTSDGVGDMTPPCIARMFAEGFHEGEGTRDQGTFLLSCYLRDRGLPNDLALVTMQEFNDQTTTPPLEEHVVASKVNSAFSDAYSFFPCQEQAFDRYCSTSCQFYANKMAKRQKRT